MKPKTNKKNPMTKKWELTNIQKDTYKYIIDFLQENGYQPSFRDIGAHFGKSVKCIADRISQLERHGLVERTGITGGLKLIGVKIKITKE